MASLVPKQEKKLTTDAWAAQTWKVALLTTAFSYDHTIHSTYASTAASEVVGTGYTLAGATLLGKASSYVDSTTVMLDATDLSWGPGATFSNVKYAECYDTVTGLIRALYELTAAQSVSNGTFTLVWHASGLIRIS
jgi:secreted trypsin-like serine protease